jgi:hypothetical protein
MDEQIDIRQAGRRTDGWTVRQNDKDIKDILTNGLDLRLDRQMNREISKE